VNTAAREKRGARGMGSVYQRSSDGRWVGALSRTGIDGLRDRKVVTGKTRDVVMDKLDEVRAGWKKSPVRKREGSQVVGRYMDGWVKRMKPRVAPSTWRQREQHTRLHIKPAIGMKRLDRLTVRHIEDMLDDIVAKGLKPRTAGHVRATLRVALGEAKHDGLITNNPAMVARAPKVRSVEQKHLTPKQARLLISSTAESIQSAIEARKTRRKPVRSAIHPQSRLVVVLASVKARVRMPSASPTLIESLRCT
jgi:integrase